MPTSFLRTIMPIQMEIWLYYMSFNQVNESSITQIMLAYKSTGAKRFENEIIMLVGDESHKD